MTATVPSPLLRAHLDIVGRWCPGFPSSGHHAEALTARTGRVLCPRCADAHEVSLGVVVVRGR